MYHNWKKTLCILKIDRYFESVYQLEIFAINIKFAKKKKKYFLFFCLRFFFQFHRNKFECSLENRARINFLCANMNSMVDILSIFLSLSLSLFHREHLLTHRDSNAIFFLWMARSKFTGQFIPAIATRLEAPLYMRRTNVFTVTEFLMVIVLTNIEQRIWVFSFFNIY